MEGESQLRISEREIWCSVVLIAAWSIIILLYVKLWHRPQRIRSVLQKQGINGPKPSFPYGNISEMQQINQPPSLSLQALDDWVYSLYPYFHTWKQRYGSVFMYSTGMKQHVYVELPELIKWIGLNTSLDISRPSHLIKTMEPLLGEGIVMVHGLKWVFQRNLLAPQFFLSKFESYVDIMEESTMAIIKKWESHKTESEEGISELVIDEDLRLLRFLPTKENKELWKLQKEVKTMILKMIKDREEENQKSNTHDNQKDLLQIILEGAASAKTDTSGKGDFGSGYNMNKLILDMCKNLFFAGTETPAVAIIWTLFLLALHPEWQQRVRSEIMETYGNVLPHCFRDMDKLRNLKALTMFIQESLRLYGPAVTIAREVMNETKLGEHVMPKGINMWLYLPALHRDPDNWGPDAREFKPERFADGVSAACKYPQTYMPFGLGSQMCLAQNFALPQMKVALSLLLSNFSFSVSPNYQHCPVDLLLLFPKYGVRLLVSKVHKTTA